MRDCLSPVLFLVLSLLCACGWAAEEPASPPAPGPKRAEFDQVLSEWKAMLSELAVLRLNFQEADDVEQAEIQKQWETLIAKGSELEPKLIAAAEAAYVEAPNADPQVTNLLVDHLLTQTVNRRYQVETDDFEEAWRVAQLLLDNGSTDPQVYNAAGIAAIGRDDFDNAEKYFKLAADAGVAIGCGQPSLDGIIDDFLVDPAKYKAEWAEEQKIRQTEAEADDLPRVLLKTTKGDIVLELFENEAPNTVANFISLVEKGFYDGLSFHRVLPGFMAQGGDPSGNGSGGPGYSIPCECYPPAKYRLHFSGTLSMAHAGRDTGGSQFFLTFVPTSFLNGRHTAFGRVIEGIDVLPKLQRRDPEAPDPPEPDRIIEAKVIRKRPHEYVPKTLPE